MKELVKEDKKKIKINKLIVILILLLFIIGFTLGVITTNKINKRKTQEVSEINILNKEINSCITKLDECNTKLNEKNI